MTAQRYILPLDLAPAILEYQNGRIFDISGRILHIVYQYRPLWGLVAVVMNTVAEVTQHDDDGIRPFLLHATEAAKALGEAVDELDRFLEAAVVDVTRGKHGVRDYQ